jgi:hypothetical protein
MNIHYYFRVNTSDRPPLASVHYAKHKDHVDC